MRQSISLRRGYIEFTEEQLQELAAAAERRVEATRKRRQDYRKNRSLEQWQAERDAAKIRRDTVQADPAQSAALKVSSKGNYQKTASKRAVDTAARKYR
jgi:hypothetical protein